MSAQWRTSGAADGAAGFRRDIDEIGTGAGRGAFGKIEAEAEIIQHRKLETHEEFAGIGRVVQVIEDDLKRIEEVRMRVTLRQ